MIDINAYVVCQINAYLDIRKFIKQYDELEPTWVKSNRYNDVRIYAIGWEGLEHHGNPFHELINFLNSYIDRCNFKQFKQSNYDFGNGIDFICFNEETGEKVYELNSYSEKMPSWLDTKTVVVLPEMPTGEKWRFIKKEV